MKNKSGINLDQYEDLKSVKNFKDYINKKQYYTIKEKNKIIYSDTGTTREKMIVQVKLCSLDLDNVTGDINYILNKLNELKKEYLNLCWGDILIDNNKSFWQGDYEGEEWNLIHEYEELDKDFNKRMELLNDIEKEISQYEQRKKNKKLKKDYDKYLELKKQFE